MTRLEVMQRNYVKHWTEFIENPYDDYLANVYIEAAIALANCQFDAFYEMFAFDRIAQRIGVNMPLASDREELVEYLQTYVKLARILTSTGALDTHDEQPQEQIPVTASTRARGGDSDFDPDEWNRRMQTKSQVAEPAAVSPTKSVQRDDDVFTKVASTRPPRQVANEPVKSAIGKQFWLTFRKYNLHGTETFMVCRRQIYVAANGAHVEFSFEIPFDRLDDMLVPERATRAELEALRFQWD